MNRLTNIIDSEIFMVEQRYISIMDINKLPIMDFSLYYTKIVMNINKKIQKARNEALKKKGKRI